MTQQKKYLAIGGAVVAVVAIGWFGLSHLATSRAQTALYAFLDDNKLRDRVQWDSLSASPFGNVRIKNVTVQTAEKGGDVIRVARIDLSDFIDSQDRKRADVRVTGLVDGTGYSPLATFDIVRAGGKVDLPPLELNVKWDVRLDDNQAKLNVSFVQPEAMSGELSAELDQVSGLVGIAKALSPGQSASRNRRGGFSLDNPFALLESAGGLRLRELKAKVKDDGYIERSKALYKRYSIAVTPDGGSPDKQRKKAFEKEMATYLMDCKQTPHGFLVDLKGRSDICSALLDFVSGESRSLRVSLKPKQPVGFVEVIGAGWANPSRVLPMLNPEFGS